MTDADYQSSYHYVNVLCTFWTFYFWTVYVHPIYFLCPGRSLVSWSISNIYMIMRIHLQDLHVFKDMLGLVFIDHLPRYYTAWKEWHIYDAHEHCPIFKTSYPPCPFTSKILPPPWPWTSNFKRTPPPPLPPSLQMITDQLRENIIQGWLFYVIRSFFQVGFHFQYQLINLVFLYFTSVNSAESSLSAYSWLYTIVCAVVQKYHEMSFIYNHSHF